ncbi:MAG: UTP--glucose-1-phosphate uridylyltransferase [Deltaproteobacteria bacterium]|nr:UTP--glucose-1-phosphate uridylyltransferase [Deltaproteobacteria bacterium]
MFDLARLPEDARAVLERHGFSELPFADLAARLARDGFDPERSRVQGRVEPPPPGAVEALPAAGDAEHRRLADAGREAVAAGRVGAIVLNGGMATRFGGVVKGTVVAARGRSFLELKLRQVHRASDGRAPVWLMNSFATAGATARHLESLGLPGEVRTFEQFAAPRLTERGELLLVDGAPSLYAPGHGDLPDAFRRSGELARFRAAGGRLLVVSNVDNLGAGLDPAILGWHLARGRAMTVELVEKMPGDVGGLPARVDGRMAIVEAFRLPRSFEPDRIPVFNTNTFVFDAALFERSWPFDWFAVRKNVGGRPAVQFERLVGQLADWADAAWLQVPRSGPESRFLPVKVPEDLTLRGREIEAVLDRIS